MRYIRLDGLRGILAVMVALNHAYMVIAIPSFASIWHQNIFLFHDLQSKIQQIFMLLGNGGLAVTIFFVLSGFVLGESAKKLDFTISKAITFYLRRLLRLYPVYLFLIAISALYMWSGFTYRIYPASSEWFRWWMNFQMTFKELVLNKLFVHTYLGGVTWTLRVIIIASFLFPFMYFIFLRANRVLSLGFVLLLLLAGFTIFDFQNFNDLRFPYMFYLGLTLPQWKGFFSSIRPSLVNWFIIPVIFTALYIRYISDVYQAMVLESLIAWLILGVLAYNEKVRFLKILEGKTFQFLGGISYSLYLVNFTVLYIFSKLVFENISPAFLTQNYLLSHSLIFIITLAITILLSIGVHRFIEKPAQALSRKVGVK